MKFHGPLAMVCPSTHNFSSMGVFHCSVRSGCQMVFQTANYVFHNKIKGRQRLGKMICSYLKTQLKMFDNTTLEAGHSIGLGGCGCRGSTSD